MKNKLELWNAKLLQVNAVNEIIKYNQTTNQRGLLLTQKDALEIVQKRGYELKKNGRIEFGKGSIGKIIEAFYNSPYISQSNYKDTLCSLIEIFYYYKNETLDYLSDDDLINYMQVYFNGTCHGSVNLLATREMDQLARDIRNRSNESADNDYF